MSINFRVPTLEACNRNVSRMQNEITYPSPYYLYP